MNVIAEAAGAAPGERGRRNASLALFAAAVVMEMVAIVGDALRHLARPVRLVWSWPSVMVVMIAGTLAIGVWRGRLWAQVCGIVFAAIYGVMSVVNVLARSYAVKFYSPYPLQVVELVVARSATFIAAAVVLLTGAPRPTRLKVGKALAMAYVALAVAEYAVRSRTPMMLG